jgi:hypothetical protein
MAKVTSLWFFVQIFVEICVLKKRGNKSYFTTKAQRSHRGHKVFLRVLPNYSAVRNISSQVTECQFKGCTISKTGIIIVIIPDSFWINSFGSLHWLVKV